MDSHLQKKAKDAFKKNPKLEGYTLVGHGTVERKSPHEKALGNVLKGKNIEGKKK